MVDLTAPLTELVAALRTAEVSARELLDLHLDRIERLDAPINAVVTLEPERPAPRPTAADEARAASGATWGRCRGVPITIKDAIRPPGIRSTGGAANCGPRADADAAGSPAVRAAGAIVFGKTNLPRWSGDIQSYNEMFGTTNNPWDLERTPGGSSGGPAAAVAMGFTAFEIGTDIGGSIRVPSHYCGVFGHKPSFGMVPSVGYLDHRRRRHRTDADINVFGPMARSVDDLELLMSTCSPGPIPATRPRGDSSCRRRARQHLPASVSPPGSTTTICPVDDSVLEVLTATIDALERAGARIDRERRPAIDPDVASRDGGRIISAACAISDTAEEHAVSVAAGYAPDHRAWDALHRERGLIRQRWSEFFEDVDVLLCPVAPVPAFRHVHTPGGSNWMHATLADHGDRPYRDLIRWCALTGSRVPPGDGAARGSHRGPGLPVGIQVVAPYLHDRTALAFARCLGEVVGGYEPPPPARPRYRHE